MKVVRLDSVTNKRYIEQMRCYIKGCTNKISGYFVEDEPAPTAFFRYDPSQKMITYACKKHLAKFLPEKESPEPTHPIVPGSSVPELLKNPEGEKMIRGIDMVGLTSEHNKLAQRYIYSEIQNRREGTLTDVPEKKWYDDWLVRTDKDFISINLPNSHGPILGIKIVANDGNRFLAEVIDCALTELSEMDKKGIHVVKNKDNRWEIPEQEDLI